MNRPAGRRATRSTRPARPAASDGPVRGVGATSRGWLVLLVVLVVVVAGALALAGRAVPVAPATERTQSVTTPEQRQLVCPGSDADAATYAGLLPDLGGGTVTAGGQPVQLQPGTRQRLEGGSGRDPLTLVTTGAASRGVFATRAAGRGGVTSCAAPRASWWFTGAGAGPAHGSQLTVANPRPGPAVVDVSVYGPDGAVTGAGLRGISVRSGQQKTVDLADAAPESGNLTVHVEVSRGLVVAALSDRTQDVLDPDARAVQEWIPDQQSPTRHLVLDGVPPPDRVRTSPGGATLPKALADGAGLVLSNPGQQAATVTVRLSDTDGSSSASGLGPQTVPPESVLTVPLAGRIEKAGTAIVVDSDRPVTAGYVVPGIKDLVHAAVGVHWRGPAAAALPEGASSTLVLTADTVRDEDGATTRPAKVRIVQRDDDGTVLDDRSPELPSRSTKRLALDPRAATVVVTSRGEVTGAVVVERGTSYSALPLTPVLAALRVPVVRAGG